MYKITLLKRGLFWPCPCFMVKLKWGTEDSSWIFLDPICLLGASLVAQMVKNLPAMPETRVQSLGWEDPLKKGMATHSSILACRIPMDRGALWATVLGSQKIGHNWATRHTYVFSVWGKGGVLLAWVSQMEVDHCPPGCVCVCVCVCVWLCERGSFGSQDQRCTQVVPDYNRNWRAPLQEDSSPSNIILSSQQIIPLLMLIFSNNFMQLSVPQERVWLV